MDTIIYFEGFLLTLKDQSGENCTWVCSTVHISIRNNSTKLKIGGYLYIHVFVDYADRHILIFAI